MTTEEQEFNDFINEAEEKAIVLKNKYIKLSVENKWRVFVYAENKVRYEGVPDLINQINLLFNTGIQ